MKEILEKYILGKDTNRPTILEEIYSSDATVHFTIVPSTISFPAFIIGNREIAKVLSADFNERYDNVKTYYLSPPDLVAEDHAIYHQGWLVMMREKETGILKFGSGYYSWFFKQAPSGMWQINKHEITIGVMLDLPGSSLTFLQDSVEQLSYPWASREKAVEIFQKNTELQNLTTYLKEGK